MPVKREATPTSDPTTPTPSPRKARSPRKVKADGDGSKRTINPWTADEDAIFLELMFKTLKDQLYSEVKSDGRLCRESPAVKAHLIAMMNKLKKLKYE